MLFFYNYSTDILLIMMSSDMRYTMVGQIVSVIIVRHAGKIATLYHVPTYMPVKY